MCKSRQILVEPSHSTVDMPEVQSIVDLFVEAEQLLLSTGILGI